MVGNANNGENKHQKQKFKSLDTMGILFPPKSVPYIWLIVQIIGKIFVVARDRKNWLFPGFPI
jgi:hypothetical protein